MTMGLTPRQAELLAFIERYQAENRGVSPSFDEMRAELRLEAKSGIHRLLCGLVERGYIRRLIGRSRAIEVLKPLRLQPPRLRVVYGPGHWEDRARLKRAEYLLEAA